MATKTKRLSLKPIEKALQGILRELERIAKRKDLKPGQKKILEKDIKNLQKLLKEIPPNCMLHNPAYDFRY